MTKVAVVTGSNKGIGFAIVRGLCKKFEGDVFLTARDTGRGEVAVRELEKEGLHPKFHQLDITDRESIGKLREFLTSSYGGLDILVNNAGIAFKRASQAPFSEQAEVTMKTNYTGTVDMCDGLFPLLRPGARVVHVASFVGEMAFEGLSKELQTQALSRDTVEGVSGFMQKFVEDAQKGGHEERGWPSSAYGMTKLGMLMMTPIQQAAIDRDQPGSDIVVNAACPGRVKTDMSSQKGELTIDEGADTPLYLSLLPGNVSSPRGCFCKNREISDWKSTAK